MMFQSKAKLIKNIEVIKNYYKIVLSCPRIAKRAQPGQFVNIRISDGCAPLLRRPFSIHRIGYRSQTANRKPNTIEILYEVIGKGTQILSQRKPGEYLDVIGPLGNGFDYRSSYIVARTSILVAGGMGVAPLLFLAERLAYSVERIAYRKNRSFKLSTKRYPLNAIVLIGAKTKAQILCEKEFKRLGCDVKIATDDGSQGFKGKVTDLLKKFLPKNQRTKEPKNQIYACGPRPMLKEIVAISKQYKISAQISLEEHMACGIGVCLGCVVKTHSPQPTAHSAFEYKRVCKEGPVFEAKEVLWW